LIFDLDEIQRSNVHHIDFPGVYIPDKGGELLIKVMVAGKPGRSGRIFHPQIDNRFYILDVDFQIRNTGDIETYIDD